MTYKDAAFDHPGTASASVINPDVLVANEGTVFLFTPLTERATKWLEDNVAFESWNKFGNAIVVEHRFALGLGAGLSDAGFVLA